MDTQKFQLPKSAYWLIAANTLPLLGVLLWGWSTFAIVFVYWSENVVIGVINLLKMLTCCPNPEDLSEELEDRGVNQHATKQLLRSFNKQKGSIGAAHHAAKLIFMPFFAFHYGMFCFVHGVFVFALLGDGGLAEGGGGGADPFDLWNRSLEALQQQHLIWAVLFLAGSHLLSFFTNYLGKGEYRRNVLPVLMIQPYGRIVVLHIAIILGAFATMALGSPAWLLVVLIVGKTALDLKFHLKQHQQQSEEPVVTSGGVA